MGDKKIILACPQCGSQNVLGIKENKTYWCRRCLAEWGKEKNGGIKNGE